MARVRVSQRFEVDADVMWAKIGDFATFHHWFPGVQSPEVDEDGRVRRFAVGSETAVERLVETAERSYTYVLEGGPLPLADYRSTLSARPDDDGCIVEWDSTFEPSGVDEPTATAIVEGIYRTGLNAL